MNEWLWKFLLTLTLFYLSSYIISFFIYICSVCFLPTLLITAPAFRNNTLYMFGAGLNHNKKESRETRCLFIPLFITLPVRSPTLICAPHQPLPCALHPACVSMNIDVNYLLPQNLWFPQGIGPTHKCAHTHLQSRVSYKWVFGML